SADSPTAPALDDHPDLPTDQVNQHDLFSGPRSVVIRGPVATVSQLLDQYLDLHGDAKTTMSGTVHIGGSSQAVRLD
ncbi:MAG: hypothetical protein LC721_05160, partial [Actinobacteria bacterium]|nr:hypothetical protein [Actinomycetota bacterium]